jgi:hypothetical protein
MRLSLAYGLRIRKPARAAIDRWLANLDDAPMQLDPVLGLLIVVCFAILFAGAAWHKFQHSQQFDLAFEAYELLPRAARRYGGRVIPLLELALAVGLLLRPTRLLSESAGALLLLSYALAIAINLRRGRHELICGCGGADERRPIAGWMVWRNVALALTLSAALLPWTSRTLSPTDTFTIVFGTAVIVLLYVCLDELDQVARRAETPSGIP